MGTKEHNIPFVEQLKKYFEQIGCNIVILYGSWARGEATSTSDIDVFAAGPDISEHYRIAEPFEGYLLDAFVYPADKLPKADKLLRLNNSIILKDSYEIANSLIEEVAKLEKIPVKKLKDWDIKVRTVWIEKMLDRASNNDAEGNYRRHWLLFALLEDWFDFNQVRYPGPKKALKFLKENQKHTYEFFNNALKPCADLEAIRILANHTIQIGKK